MGAQSDQPLLGAVWGLAAKQHWVITRAQLLDLGLTARAIKHSLAAGACTRATAGSTR